LNRVGTGRGNSKLLNQVNDETRFIHLQHSMKKKMSQSDILAISKNQFDLTLSDWNFVSNSK